MIEESADAREFAVAIDDDLLLIGIQVTPGYVEGNFRLLGVALEFREQRAVLRLGPGLNGPFVQGLRLVGNDKVEIEIDGISETLAAWACAVRIVEREKAWLRFLVAKAVALALKALGVAEMVPLFFAFLRRSFENYFS